MNNGYHMPFLMPRGIRSMKEINYQITYQRLSIQKYLELASRECRSRFMYFMNADDEEDFAASDCFTPTESADRRRR